METITPKLPRRLARLPRVLSDRALDVRMACTPDARLLGLAGLPGMPLGSGLLLTETRSIHTFGMRFPLELAWLDVRGYVIRLDRDIGPCRVSVCRHADSVVELPVGSAEHCPVVRGMLVVAGGSAPFPWLPPSGD